MPSARRMLRTTTKASAPRGDVVRLRLRVSIDMLVTLAITALAVGLAVGYQVLRRLGPREAGPR